AYDVYVVGALDRGSFLGPFTLGASGPAALDLSLSPAFPVSGVTTLETGARVGADLKFVSTAGSVVARSDGNGNFLVRLPTAAYTVDADAAGSERTVSVTYHASASFTLSTSNVVNLELAKVVRRGVSLEWDSTQAVTIPVGSSVDYVLTVANTGNVDDSYSFAGSAVGFTFAFNVDKVALPFGPTGNKTTVRVTLTAATDAKVDHGPITVVARSAADATVAKSASLTVTIAPFKGLTASVTSDAPVWDGRFLNYTLSVHNTGNGAGTYRLTIRNPEELSAAGWHGAFVASAGGTAEASLDLKVDANATLRPILRLQKTGGAAGAIARISVADVTEPAYNALVTVSIQMPNVVVDGSVRATGSGISLEAPGIDLPTAAFLVSFLAIIAAVAYLTILRRRSR
ncbi:MAG TPA: hypothetical protein VEM95_01275, partial [Thermoplasmata archaeon]|nr:hypothetical protein [Thermoplasmata archaeon]